MENETIEITYSVGLIESEIVSLPLKEKLGDFHSIEELNDFLTAENLHEKHNGSGLVLDIRGLLNGRYPLYLPYYELEDCGPVSLKDQEEIRNLLESWLPRAISEVKDNDVTVDEIPFHFCLEVTSPDESAVYEGEFSNYYQLNEFILKTKDLPEYKDVTAKLWPLEVVGDNITEATGFYHEMKRYDVITTEDEKEIEELILKAIDDKEEMTHHVTISLQPELYREPEDYHRKESMRGEFTYICPTCMHEINDCRCEDYPWIAVQIDTVLLPVIRELNMKGYRTAFCCAGHHPGEQMNIVFQHDYCFYDVPDGFYYAFSSFNLFCPCPEGLSDEEYLTFRQGKADALLKWAETL